MQAKAQGWAEGPSGTECWWGCGCGGQIKQGEGLASPRQVSACPGLLRPHFSTQLAPAPPSSFLLGPEGAHRRLATC